MALRQARHLVPLHFVSFVLQLRLVGQIFTAPILQQVPMIRIEHQLRSVGHRHAAD